MMKSLLCMYGVVVLFVCTLTAIGQTSGSERVTSISMESLEAKIKTKWDSGKWSDESVALMKTVWDEFKKAQMVDDAQLSQSIGGIGTPNPKGLEDYVGKFRLKDRSLEVQKKGDQYVVILQGQELPAAVWNKSIIFASGDVVGLPLPFSGPKQHGVLEMWSICEVNGKFAFMRIPDSSQLIEMTKN